MATCKICGKEDKGLPRGWVNWECGICFWESLGEKVEVNEEEYEIVGAEL